MPRSNLDKFKDEINDIEDKVDALVKRSEEATQVESNELLSRAGKLMARARFLQSQLPP